jgi:CHAT domain-containing protein
MNLPMPRWMVVAALGLGVLLFIGNDVARAQAPASPPPASPQLQARDKLVKQIDELLQAGKFDEAVLVAERLLEVERWAGKGTTNGVADALSRLAELAELRGDWSGAIVRRKEALALRERLDGKDHLRTADARIALAFAEKVVGLVGPDRTKITAALCMEQEAGRLDAQGKYTESERLALEVMETYRAVVGAESPEVARMWHAIGRSRLGRNNTIGAKEATELAVAIRRKALPRDHPDLGRSLNNLGNAERTLRNFRRALELHSEVLAIRLKSLPKDDPDIADSLTNVGAIRFDLREYTAARMSFEGALAIRRKALPTGHPDIGKSLTNLGHLQRYLGESAPAKASHQDALAILRKSLPKEDLDIAACLSNLGLVQHDLREYGAAKASHQDALAIRRKALPKDHPDIARSLSNLGIVQQGLREYAAAKASHQDALAIFRKSLPKNHPDIAQCLDSLGIVQFQLREYGAAKASFEEALAIRRKALSTGHPDIADSLNSLGNVQSELREYTAARASYDEALAIKRKALPKDHPDIASSLNNLGIVQRELREYAAAKASHEEALAIYRKSLPKDHPDIASSLTNLGAVQCDLREYPAAKASFEEALAIRRKALPKDHPDLAQGLNGLGNVQWSLREYAAAKASNEEALAIYRKALPNDHPNIAVILDNLGNVQRELRDYAAAKATHEEALAIFRKSLPKDHPFIAHSLDSLGNVQLQLSEYGAAKASLEEALAIYRRAYPKDHPAIGHCLKSLGLMQAQLREYGAAKASCEEAVAIYRKAYPKDHPLVAESLLELAAVSLASGAQAAGALPALTEATDLYQADQLQLAVAQAEPEQLTTAATSHLSLSLLLSATLASKADPGPTCDRVVRGKGSVTAQQRWVRQARDTADPATTQLLEQLGRLTQQIVGLSVGERTSDRSRTAQDEAASLRALCDSRARLEQQLGARTAAFRTIQDRFRIGSDEVRAALPMGTALVDVVDYLHEADFAEAGKQFNKNRRLAAFVIRPERGEIFMISLGSTQALADLIDRWRSSYSASKPPAADGADPGAELRKLLWEPLEKNLRGVKVVLVSPDGPLNGLSWGALPDARVGTFLIHEYAFAVVPVPQLLPEILRLKSPSPDEQPSLLLAGGIDFGTEKSRDEEPRPGKLPAVPFFGPLPGAESEVNDLRTQFEDAFPDAPAPKRMGKDKAIKEAVVAAAPSYWFVHLATHGFFAVESVQSAVQVAERADLLRGGLHLKAEATGRHPGLLSGLVFAGVNRPDRPPERTILTALEAADLNLEKVELVTLSACDTGRGRVAGGEGVLGLQRAFQLAGARSVVASLWKVPDEETHQLMREFYRRVWSKDPVSKAEALRQAQIWMLENWKPRGTLDRPAPQGPPSPYYWAAFVLSGDWR